MSLIEVNWAPSRRHLRQFAAIAMFALPLVGWWWHGSTQTVMMLALAGLAIMVISWPWPNAVKPLFILLSLVALPIGMAIGEAALIAIFFLVFLPIGLVFRLVGRDVLQRDLDRECCSYWQSKRSPRSVASYYRQS